GSEGDGYLRLWPTIAIVIADHRFETGMAANHRIEDRVERGAVGIDAVDPGNRRRECNGLLRRLEAPAPSGEVVVRICRGAVHSRRHTVATVDAGTKNCCARRAWGGCGRARRMVRRRGGTQYRSRYERIEY